MSAIRLPSRLPAGTRYVIEGRPGKAGKMRIVSRQLILPNGKQFDLTAGSFDRPRTGQVKHNHRAKKA